MTRYRKTRPKRQPTLMDDLTKTPLGLAEVRAILNLAVVIPDFIIELDDGTLIVVRDRRVVGKGYKASRGKHVKNNVL